MIDPNQVIRALNKLPGESGRRFSEVYERREFIAYRQTKDGRTQKVTIEILYAGDDERHSRFHVYAEADDGATAAGNPDATIDVAIALVHWGELDHPR